MYYLGDIGELEGLRIELEDSRDMLEQEKRSRTNLERKLQELEQILDDQRIDSENIQHTLTAKVRSALVEPGHEISNNVVCATSKASDQPAHMHSLIRAFASHLNII